MTRAMVMLPQSTQAHTLQASPWPVHLSSRNQSFCFSYPTGVLQGLAHVYSAPFFKALHECQTFFFFLLPFFSPFFIFKSIPCCVIPSQWTHLSPPEKQTIAESWAVGGGKPTAGCSSSSNPSIPSPPINQPDLVCVPSSQGFSNTL